MEVFWRRKRNFQKGGEGEGDQREKGMVEVLVGVLVGEEERLCRWKKIME